MQSFYFIGTHKGITKTDHYCYGFGGDLAQSITEEELLKICEKSVVPHLLVDETVVIQQIDLLKTLIENQKIEHLIIFNNHPFDISKETMEQLNILAKTNKITIIVHGHYDQPYNNIKLYHLDWQVYRMCGSDTLYLLSQILKKKRLPKYSFILQVVFKDEFRKTVGKYLKNLPIWEDIIHPPFTTTQTMDRKTKNFLDRIKQHRATPEQTKTLECMGNGLPNFKLYEQAFCEIVLETRNEGSWHFSEKTFRPVALGIPIVHLGHKPIYDRFIDYGYQIYDNNFYSQWHSNIDLQEKLLCLKDFLNHIKNDQLARNEMERIAEYNYQHFWKHQKNLHIKNTQKMFDDIWGEDLFLYKIYEQLNF